jgi:hypothetical protein
MSSLKSILAVCSTDDSNLGLKMAQFLNHKHIDAVPMQANFQSDTRFGTTQPAQQPVLRICPLVSMRIRIQLFCFYADPDTDRIQGAKSMRIRPFAVTES